MLSILHSLACEQCSRGIFSFALFLLLAQVFSAEPALQGENWLGNPGFEKFQKKDWKRSLPHIPGGYSVSSGVDVDVVEDAHSGKRALSLSPRNDGEWIRFPIYINPDGRFRKFVFTFWAKTEFELQTGHAVSFYLHMSTPGYVGVGSGFPRTRFRYLKDWTHIGGTISLGPKDRLGWFRFILYTTKPGLRIFLDDVFFSEVTDLPEEKVRSLLEGATLRPDMTLRPPEGEYTDYKKGNKIENSSFELPSNSGWGWLGARKLERVERDGAHGRYSLRVGYRLHYKRVALRPFHKHTFSAYFKADGGKRVIVEFLNAFSEHYKTKIGRAGIRYVLQVGNEWKRYSFSFVPPPNPRGSAYALRLSGRVLVDAVQLEEGELSDYALARRVEYGFTTPALANLFTVGEPVKLTLHACNSSNEPVRENLTMDILDYWNRALFEQKLELKLSPGQLERVVRIPERLRGCLRARLRSKDGSVLAEQLFSIIAPPSDPGLKPSSRFGALVHFTDKNLTIARRVGVKWSRDHRSFCWFRVEPEPDKWTFKAADEKINRALRYGVSVFGVLHGTPEWASIDGTRGYASIPRDWKKWEEYVRRVVEHFKGRVRVWEVWNEPQSAELYYDLVRHSYPPAKEANPECLLIGLSSTNYSGGFLNKFVRLGGLKYLDEVSSHIYQYSSHLRRKLISYRKRLGGKPLWNTEAGGWGGGTFYSNRLDYEPERHGVREVARYYTVLASLPGVRMNCYYWNIFPGESNPAFEYRWTFFEYDSSLKPEGVAYAVTANQLEEAEFSDVLSEDDLRAYLFEREGKPLLVLWWEGEGQAKLPFPRIAKKAKAIITDIMGNETKLDLAQETTLTVDADAKFISFEGLLTDDVSRFVVNAKDSLRLPD